MANFANLVDAFFNLAIGFNTAIDWVFLLGGLLLFIAYPVYFVSINYKKYQKRNKTTELLTQAVWLALLFGVVGILWCIPEFVIVVIGFVFRWTFANTLSQIQTLLWIFSVVRLAEFSIFMYLVSSRYGREYGEDRWKYSVFGHLAVLFLGFTLYRWVGVVFVSLPIFAAYYSVLYSQAIVLVPTSNPDDRTERSKRFRILATYAWGIQAPLMLVGDQPWSPAVMRIKGNASWEFSDFPIPFLNRAKARPGLMWTKSHQAVAIGGSSFKRVENPGAVFLGKSERVQQIFDLRLQTRVGTIDVISRDGVSFNAVVLAVFRIDRDQWDRKIFDQARSINPFFNHEGYIDSSKLVNTNASFPYSPSRVQAALMTTSTRTRSGLPDQNIYWDQWILSMVEDQARKVVAQKNLNEFWRPSNDVKFANALDTLAHEIKANAEPLARSAGILLIAARIVNFMFSAEDKEHPDDISKQQIMTWASEWDRKRSNIIAEAEAEAEHAQQEARAYAEAILLNSIAEGLQKTQEIDQRLPRYVIAMRFLSALQDYVHKQHPADGQGKEGEQDATGRQKDLLNYFKEWQDNFFPSRGKEK